MGVSKDDPIANAVSLAKSRTSGEALQYWKPRLEALLATQGDARGAAEVGDMSLPSDGGSSGTILFTARYADSSEDALVLRFEPEVGQMHESDIAGQYHVLAALQHTDVPSPRVFALDADGRHLGVTGFLMHRIDGRPLPSTYPINGPLFEADPATRRQMIIDALGALVKIHRVDWRGLGLDRVTRHGHGSTWLEKDLDWYLAALRHGSPEAEAAMRPVLDWLLAHQFEPAVVSLCHGDSSLHNYMYKDGRLVGVLDWEFAFIGAPEIDLGFQSCAHDMLTLDRPPLDGVPDMLERCAIYETIAGRKLHHWPYYLTAARLKMYIQMALAFRGLPPEMAHVRDRYVGHSFDLMMADWETLKR